MSSVTSAFNILFRPSDSASRRPFRGALEALGAAEELHLLSELRV